MYVVKIDIDTLSKKDYETFVKSFDSDSFKKFILKQTKKTIVINLPLFDYLEYEVYSKKSYLKKLRFSLLRKNNEGKFEFVITRCKAGSEDYDNMLRLTRLERTA